MKKLRIGIDLGGTKTEALALGPDGAELARIRQPTPAGDYAGTIRTIGQLVETLERQFGATATIGLGTPGAISTRTGLMKNSNSTVLNGRPFQADVEAHLGRPVRIANDANCMVLSEAFDGAGADARVVFGVILGTGVGGGIVVDRRIIEGRNRIGGEWGHNPLPWAEPADGPPQPCYCGRSGCIETFLSGAGLSRDHRARTGEQLTAADIAEAAGRGDTVARASLVAYRDRLGRALASVVDILDPDVIVLAGGLSNINAIYEGLPDEIARRAFSDGIDTPVRRARHGDSSGVRGAAWLWEADA